MTPTEEMFDANIKLLQSIQFEGMDRDTRQNLMDSVADIKTEYDEASAKAKDDKNYAALQESIAKNLPNIVKGALSAAAAFKKGDNLAGSAALMDICASAIPILTSLFAAAGPEGMVVGALFSVIGQILAFFEPPKPSLESQIKKMLAEFGAELKLDDIEAAEMAVAEYTASLRGIGKALPKILAMPLRNEDDGDKFFEKLEGIKVEFAEEQRKLNNPEFASWQVAAWLKKEKNYEVEQWPEVLGHWCQMYTNLVTANIMLRCLLNPAKMEELRVITKQTNTDSPLPSDIRKEINVLVLKLDARVQAAQDMWQYWGREALKVVQATKSNAKARGLYVTLDPNGYLWAATGRKGFQSGWDDIKSGGTKLSNGYANRFSITVPKEEAGLLKPKYNILWCQGSSASAPADWPNVRHAMLSHGPPVTYAESREISRLEYCADIWSVPAPKDQTPRDPKASFVYAAKDYGQTGSVKLFELEPNSQLKIGNWEPASKSKMVNVRVVTHPPAALLDDPDRDGLPPDSPLLGGVDHYNSIAYGALHSSPYIFVDQQNKNYHVPSPWPNYNGIAVDDYYLWVFGPERFACATHASVVKCTLGKSSSPRWMSYSIPGEYLFDSYELFGGELYSWENSRDRQKYDADKVGPLKGLVSLSPCKDGTLVASIYKRTIRHPDRDSYVANDSLAPLYTMDYNVDLKGGTINVGTLVKSDTAVGIQVQKMAIPCWSLFESLEADLQTKKTT